MTAAATGKGNGVNHAWQAEHEAILRAKAKDGLSASEIAAEIGHGITRNAVIGKAARLGVPLRGKPGFAKTAVPSLRLDRKKPTAPKRPAPRCEKNRTVAMLPEIARAAALPAIVVDSKNAFAAPPGVALVPVMGLHDSSCRWPFRCDDGVTRYCGREAKDGSWCAEHGRRVFAGDARPTMKAYAPIQREARAS